MAPTFETTDDKYQFIFATTRGTTSPADYSYGKGVIIRHDGDPQYIASLKLLGGYDGTYHSKGGRIDFLDSTNGVNATIMGYAGAAATKGVLKFETGYGVLVDGATGGAQGDGTSENGGSF